MSNTISAGDVTSSVCSTAAAEDVKDVEMAASTESIINSHSNKKNGNDVDSEHQKNDHKQQQQQEQDNPINVNDNNHHNDVNANSPSITDADADDDDNGSVRSASSHVSGATTDTSPSQKNGRATNNRNARTTRYTLAKTENKAVRYLRMVVISVMVCTAVFVSLAVFFYTRKEQVSDFEAQFHAHAGRLIESFHETVARKLSAIDALSVSITSYAIDSGSTFPNVTIPHFHLRGANSRILSDGLFIYWLPLVTDETRPGWEAYSVENQNQLIESFIQESKYKAVQDVKFGIGQEEEEENGDHDHDHDHDDHDDETRRERELHLTSDNHFHTTIWSIIGQGHPPKPYGNATHPNVYLPLWQLTPSLPLVGLLNVDLLDFQAVKALYNEALKTEKVVLSGVTNLVDPNDENNRSTDVFNAYLTGGQYRQSVKEYTGDPVSSMVYPVFDSFDDGTVSPSTRKIAGLLQVNLYWRLYFDRVLPDNIQGIICVLSNSFNQTFSYQVDGPTVTFLGPGDYHSSEFDHLEYMEDVVDYIQQNESLENTAFTSVPLNGSFNRITLRVYPSQYTKDQFVSNREPIINTVVVALIFLFSAIAFGIYDCLVERRQTIVMDQAVRSTAVVSSLFPETVRDRLLDTAGEQENNNKGSNHKEKGDDHNKNKVDKKTQQDPKHAGQLKKQYSSLLTSRSEHTPPSFPDQTSSVVPLSATISTSVAIKGRPIADLFLATTVMFADLVGFTRWSAKRKPEQVFMLLESLYHAFDEMASRRHVFKVETIGDCYMAVTGVPNPQPQHAFIMAKFAIGCVEQMRHVLQDLASTTINKKIDDDDTNSNTSDSSDHGGIENDDNQVQQQKQCIVGDIEDTLKLSLRVGLHSGAVTAGVLRGEKSRFQLFGDTVNTAARMESSGSPGKIHCSETTANELYKIKKDSWVIPRDDVVTPKGKGAMKTFWIQQPLRNGSSSQINDNSNS